MAGVLESLEVTARENILRVLEHLGLDDSIAITCGQADRVFGWPVNDNIVMHAVAHFWVRDLKESASHFHGSNVSYREPNVSPALQLVMHDARPGDPWDYFLELDLDFHCPNWRKPWSVLLHGLEVARNAITGRKTNQEEIAKALDRRFHEGRA